jgi:hypothetical protein
MSQYAAGTDVSVARTIAELERLVSKYGATGFGYARDDNQRRSRVVFRIADRVVRFDVPQPDWHDFVMTPKTYRRRSQASATQLAAEEEKRRWRALGLVVKALLVGVADGVITLSDAFLPYTVIPGGETFGEHIGPQLDTIYATGQPPSLLPSPAPEMPAIEGRS